MSKKYEALLEIPKYNVKDNFGKAPKVLTIDIETTPNIAYVWGLWDQNVSLNQLIESTRVMCFAAKWHDKKKVEFYSEHNMGHEAMIRKAWELLNEADIVVSYNGVNFDVKHLQREFIEYGLTPASPFKNVDLLRTARSQFKFPSNKLDYVGNILGLGEKVKHPGQELWTKAMNGDGQAWKLMEKYNKQDVLLTEALFDYLGPWIKSLPHRSLWTGEYGCYACGSTALKHAGWHQTPSNIYTKLHCEDCGAWNRGVTGKTRITTRQI
jgi:DNA polymerase elongation subunit (family B)